MKQLLTLIFTVYLVLPLSAQQTQKPVLHGSNWMAITGKPLAATAGAMIFQKKGNAVDAACAMLAAACTMWDTLSWGGETQVLIYNPRTKKVIAINAMGFAPTGATPEFFKNKGFNFPPEYGPLAATTPGTPGGLIYMLANYGTMSLEQVLEPAMQMAAGYPIEAQAANIMERYKPMIKEWPYSRKVFYRIRRQTSGAVKQQMFHNGRRLKPVKYLCRKIYSKHWTNWYRRSEMH